jgi:hypothetical protein
MSTQTINTSLAYRLAIRIPLFCVVSTHIIREGRAAVQLHSALPQIPSLTGEGAL